MARPRARDFDEKRPGLLVEAARVFAAMGMERASMAQIASAAGMVSFHPGTVGGSLSQPAP